MKQWCALYVFLYSFECGISWFECFIMVSSCLWGVSDYVYMGSSCVFLMSLLIVPQPPMFVRVHFITRFTYTCHRMTLQWRHNGPDGVSNHQPYDCLLNRLFRRTSKKTSKLRVIGLCEGNSPVTGEFPAQRASNAENYSIWWRHHDMQPPMFVRVHFITRFTYTCHRMTLQWRHNGPDGV